MKQQNFFKRSLYFFREFWGWIAVVVFLMIAGQVLATFSPYFFGKSVDAVTNLNMKLAFIYIGLAFLLALIQSSFLNWAKEKVELLHLDDYIEKSFSTRSLSRMLEFSIGQHINEHSGVKQTVVNKGQPSLVNLVFTLLYDVFPYSIQVIITLGILSFFDWHIALIATMFVVSFVLLAYRRNKRLIPEVEIIRKKNQNQSKLQSELFRNSTLIIAEAQELRTKNDFDTSGKNVVNYATTTWLKFHNSYYYNKSLLIVGQYFSLLMGVYLIMNGQHSVGMFVTLFAWLSTIFGNLTQIMVGQRRILMMIADIKKYYDLLDIIPDINPNIDGKTIEHFGGKIEFKNVSFAYPYRSNEASDDFVDSEKKSDEHALTNISLTIPAGAKIGFVGASGAGKSTIVNLMRRYYDPTQGEILIDGVPLRELNLRWFRSKIGNVEQKIELFDRSIRDNIVFGLTTEVTDEKINKAVQEASLDEFIAGLKDHGLDTMIGEGGIKISGGERQRVGIARALIKDPKILIFDEATSALDSVNEKLIHDAINRGAKGRTTIMIAHRLSTVKDADKIFVVDDGKIVGEGTHAELIKNCPEYQNLIEHQMIV